VTEVSDGVFGDDGVLGGAAAVTATPVSFDDLVTAATVGVSRRPLAIGALDGPAAAHAAVLDAGDPAAALLEAAALLGAGDLAGLRPAADVVLPTPADDDGTPELSVRAARLLRRVAASDTETLADLLTAAGSAGYRMPAPLLPTMLDLAARSKALRPAIGAVLGARGRWLAAWRPDWQAMTEPPASSPATATVTPTTADGVSGADEATLEKALDHKREAVRAAARRELARRPDSAFSRRAARRAAAALRLEDGVLRRRLVATLPGRLDDAMARDGIPARPAGPGIGTGAWLLIQVVAAAPLRCWEAMFGLDAERLTGLRVADDLDVAVHAGWRLAAIRQRDEAWALALLQAGAPGDVDHLRGVAWPENYQLAAALPAHSRAARAAALLDVAAAWLGRPAAGPLAGEAAVAAIPEVANCPGPWPDALADAFTAMLRRTVGPGPRPGWPRELMLIAARNLPVTGPADHAAELARLAATPNCPAPWAAVLRRTADTIALRRDFYEEIR